MIKPWGMVGNTARNVRGDGSNGLDYTSLNNHIHRKSLNSKWRRHLVIGSRVSCIGGFGVLFIYIRSTRHESKSRKAILGVQGFILNSGS